MVSVRACLVALLGLGASSAQAKNYSVVTVTGATGRTGSLVYTGLKDQGVIVRALVRNVTKARELLGCEKCDESEGIYVGDVTKEETLSSAMEGANALVITTGPGYHCWIPKLFIGCHYYKGGAPKDISWEAVETQVKVFARKSDRTDKHVVLLSTEGTTNPDNPLEKIDNGHGLFYALNGEASVMNSGLKYTILKPSMLTDDGAGKKQILTHHGDRGWPRAGDDSIARADVARLLVFAVQHEESAAGLSFDVSSGSGTPPADLASVFKNATYDWDHHERTTTMTTVHVLV